MAVQVVRADLTQKVEAGWKRKELAEYYGLPETQMAQLLRDAGLKIRKFHAPKYVLVDSIEDSVQEIREGEVIQEDVNNQITEEIPAPNVTNVVEEVKKAVESPTTSVPTSW